MASPELAQGRPRGPGDGALADAEAAPAPSRVQAFGSPSRYHLVVIALIYVLPLLVMLFSYSVIGLTLWRREVPRHQTHGASLRHLQAKKKVGAGGGARRGGGASALTLFRSPSAPPPEGLTAPLVGGGPPFRARSSLLRKCS